MRREDGSQLDPRFTTPRVVGIVLAVILVGGGLSLWLAIGDDTPASELFWPIVGGVVLGVGVAWIAYRWMPRPPIGLLLGICVAGVALSRLAPATVQVAVIGFTLALFSGLMVFVHVWPGPAPSEEG